MKIAVRWRNDGETEYRFGRLVGWVAENGWTHGVVMTRGRFTPVRYDRLETDE